MSLPSFIEDLNPELYESDNYVVLDWETDTSHGDYGNAVHEANHLLLGCVKLGPGHWRVKSGNVDSDRVYAHWGSEFDMVKIVEAIEDADFLVAQNAKYELMWLKRAGLDMQNTFVFDTKIAEYVLLGNRASGDDNMRALSTSLDMCCRRRGFPVKDPAVDKLMKQGINPLNMPRTWLQGRCEQDVHTTEALFKEQLAFLQQTSRLGHVYTRCLLTPVLADIEFTGMNLDPEAVEKEYEEYAKKFDELNREMEQFTGGINWRSTKQLAEFLYDELGFSELKNRDGSPKRTSAGKRKTDKKTLEALKATNKRQRKFVELRSQLGKVSSALSKNLEFFIGVVREQGNVFHAEFNQTTTATHRLSSNGISTQFEMFDKPKKVQFQNLPRVFKPLFCAREDGWFLCETDGSQLEFRVAAHLGRDEQARTDILNPDFDAHVTSASEMEQIKYETLLERYRAGDPQAKLLRQDAKPETFKPLYGGKYGTKRQMRWYQAFAERYSGITEAQGNWKAEVLSSKRLVTEWGFRFYWPYARISQSGYVNVETAVCNYPVQAFATAEIIPIAVTFFWHRVEERGLREYIRPVNTIHDSIICEVHPDYVEQYREISIQAFTRDVYRFLERVYGVKFDFVPLGVGITIGTHWSKGKEESYDVFYDGRVVRGE